MRILYIRNLNQVAEIQAYGLTQHNHVSKIYEPNLTGNEAPLPLKLALMPGRILSLRHVVGKLNRNYFDIAHIHWASYGMLGFVSRIPFIVECHGSDVRYRLKKPFFRAMLASVFQRAASVHCITPDLLPVVQTVCPQAKFFPGPVDTDRFVPAEDIHASSERQWTILLFSRLDPVKRPEVAVAGIASFAQRHPDVRVKLLDWGLLKEQFKNTYSERFEFVPFVPPEKVQQLIWSANVVVGQCLLGILSFCELQAMSCAKPVICPFHYQDAYPTPPPLCQATTAEEVDQQLEYLFTHPEAGITLGQKARKWVIENHDYRALSLKLETVYQSIMGGSSV
jgi:glycosyltransferase involved in cell wall biosynthesis